MKEIISTRAAPVLLMRSLHYAAGRRDEGCYLAEGGIALREALDAGLAVRTVLVDHRHTARYGDLIARCPDWSQCPPYIIDAAAETKTPQGLLAVVEIPSQGTPERWRRALVLEELQDPGNIGTIIRLCAAAGWDGLLISHRCADPYAPKVVRASTGLVARVSIWRGELMAMLEGLRREGCAIAATTTDGEDYYQRPYLPRLVLAIGNEARGLSQDMLQLATHRWRLPMPGGVQSLNAAMAATAMVYDEIRLEGHP